MVVLQGTPFYGLCLWIKGTIHCFSGTPMCMLCQFRPVFQVHITGCPVFKFMSSIPGCCTSIHGCCTSQCNAVIIQPLCDRITLIHWQFITVVKLSKINIVAQLKFVKNLTTLIISDYFRYPLLRKKWI